MRFTRRRIFELQVAAMSAGAVFGCCAMARSVAVRIVALHRRVDTVQLGRFDPPVKWYMIIVDNAHTTT